MMMYECTWIDTEFDIEVGTYDMIVPLPGHIVNGFTVEKVVKDTESETATVYGIWK